MQKGVGGLNMCVRVFFFQAEDGIRGAQESRGLGDVYKRQEVCKRNDSPSVVVLISVKNSALQKI